MLAPGVKQRQPQAVVRQKHALLLHRAPVSRNGAAKLEGGRPSAAEGRSMLMAQALPGRLGCLYWLVAVSGGNQAQAVR